MPLKASQYCGSVVGVGDSVGVGIGAVVGVCDGRISPIAVGGGIGVGAMISVGIAVGCGADAKGC